MQSKRELYGLQMLRGIAALSVVLHHTLEESNSATTAFSPNWVTTYGGAGVDIFFVISGFIILYTSCPPNLPTLSPQAFIFRRATRIYPLYWICCGAMFGLILIGFMKSVHLSPKDIVLSFALLPSAHLIISVSWTLICEIYFYLVFAATLLTRNRLATALGTTAAIAILTLIAPAVTAGVLREFLTDPIVYEFVFGLWLAMAFMRSIPHWRLSPMLAVLGFILLAAASLYVSHPNTNGLTGWSRLFAWGLPAVLIVAASLSIPAPRNAIQRQLVFLGDASYATYLTHGFVMIAYAFLLKRTPLTHVPQIMIVPLVVLMATALGIIAHLFIEKPTLRLIRRWSASKRFISVSA